MALNAAATLVINAGNYFLADVDTPFPEDGLASIPSPWENVGHTSLEEILSFSSEGGEATVLGSLQNKNLRTTYSNRTETFAFTLQQFDEDSLKLYFGQNMVDVNEDGSLLGVNSNPTPTQSAFLAVYVDQSNHFGIYIPKAEIFRGDDFSFEDTESLAGFPLSVTPLQSGSNAWTYAMTPLGGSITP